MVQKQFGSARSNSTQTYSIKQQLSAVSFLHISTSLSSTHVNVTPTVCSHASLPHSAFTPWLSGRHLAHEHRTLRAQYGRWLLAPASAKSSVFGGG